MRPRASQSEPRLTTRLRMVYSTAWKTYFRIIPADDINPGNRIGRSRVVSRVRRSTRPAGSTVVPRIAINTSVPMRRHGIRICGSRGHPVVRRALIHFAKWLRQNIEFPIRVPVYLQPGATLTTIEGEVATASFFAPSDRAVEPYIRIATGDYPELQRELGRDNALACFLYSLAHEVLHYRQWVEMGDTWEKGVTAKASRLVDRYAKTRAHP